MSADQTDIPERITLKSQPGVMNPTTNQPPIERGPVNRITCIENYIHERHGEEPTQVMNSSHRLVTIDEPAYTRPTLKVGEEWMELDFGWGKDWPKIGLIIIENLGDKASQKNLSPQEILERDGKVLELSDTNAIGSELPLKWYIFPSEAFKGCPSDGKALRIRCQKGITRVTVTIMPG